MSYIKECVDYKHLRKDDYYNYGRMIAMNSLSTPELVEYFGKSLADSNPTLSFNIVDYGDFNIAIQCNNEFIYRGSYSDVGKTFSPII